MSNLQLLSEEEEAPRRIYSLEEGDTLKLRKKEVGELSERTSDALETLHEESNQPDTSLDEGEEEEGYELTTVRSARSTKGMLSILEHMIVPDIEDISEETVPEELITVIEVKEQVVEEKVKDIGTFVEEIEVVEEEEIVQEEEESKESESEEDEEIKEDSELLALLEPMLAEAAEEAKTEEAAGDDVLTKLLQFKEELVIEIDDEEYAAQIQREFEARRARAVTENVVNDLIAEAIECSEYVSPATILRQTLDKSALLRELDSKLDILKIEQQVQIFLNRKVVEYFRRKKEHRVFADNHPDTVTADRQKYKTATKRLDAVLGKIEDIKTVSEDKLLKLRDKSYKMEQKAERELADFEDMMRKTYHREGQDKYNAFMNRYVGRMQDLRTEISKSRLVLIKHQHSYARMKLMIDKIEDLGEGLTVRDYEHLTTEVLAVGKKIEERNNDLSKVRTRCNADLHILAHMRGKQRMMRDIINIQNGSLNDMLAEKHALRAHLHDLKEQRTRIRNDIHNLSHSGGLLDKPALMLDYDMTVDRIYVVQEKLRKARKKYNELYEKVEWLEGLEKSHRAHGKRGIKGSITKQMNKELALFSDEYYDEMEQSL